jgi:sortase A
MRIAAIDLRKYVVDGTGTSELQKGPGLYPEGGYPGSGRPVAIAGHRTTFGAPFLHIDRLKPGDPIIIDMPYARFTYVVSRTKIIAPDDWSILEPGAALKTARARKAVATTGTCRRGTCEHLVMTACHPKHSAAQRIAVFAELSSVALRESGS